MEKDKILIVEDEEDTRFILNRLLTKNGYHVETASNGVEALEKIKVFFPKVIVADWTMPEMDGLQLCDILKSKKTTKIIYFIVLTARASLKDRVTGLDVGSDDFLVKPVENKELLARIRSGIRIYNLQNELKKTEHNKAIIELATTIGHKINNPLGSLKMSFVTLQSELNDAQKSNLKEEIFVIKESIKRIQSFVKALQNLETPSTTEYLPDNKMLKIDE